MLFSLNKLQSCFKDAILDEDTSDIYALIDENRLSAQCRLQIYQNNFNELVKETLKGIYPTVHSLVGADFFGSVTQHYSKNYPSHSGDLAQFGKQFPNFLADFIPTKGLIYLPEVARLDWAYHEVFHAAEPPVFAIEKLQAIPEEQYGRIKFALHPASRILMCQFPILKIWEICQNENNEESVNLDIGGDDILVIRRQLKIEFEKLSKGEATLLTALGKGLTFTQACVLALEVEPEYNINSHLQHCLFSGIIVNFTL
ncbi:DNA-binding domain-containing protein [Legionella brunensis]|uniref:Putative DNA-binding domain-containing protein n=1 Tax=Legionella brunensis TaxID=29422 RepID=A0A0W0STY7_9GAMM|nr:DNA-binding domain-containing protein [Legionella brunensis]KTC86855.1 hypothetical protein Lbru_0084 [Legionella brunensis]